MLTKNSKKKIPCEREEYKDDLWIYKRKMNENL